MTIKLLTPYKGYPALTKLTLDSGTETGLVNAKQATTDLTGAIDYVAPSFKQYPIDVFQDADTGQFVESDGSPLVSGAGNAAILTIAAPDGTDVGDVLTATPSTGWTVSGYQWTRDGADISGATSSTYTLTSADGGKLVGCRAVDAVYSALTLIPSYAPTLPAGYLSLNSGVLSLGSSVLSLV